MLDYDADRDRTQTHVALTKGTMVLHYRIVEKIGAGGMGEVYLAEDTKLKRRVAMKFLPTQFIADKALKARFMREAEATAKLNHPNIVTIYDVSEFQGRPFIAMELVEGQTLKELSKDKQLDLNRVVELAIQICDGLSAAHEGKVVHRDIKPANVVIDSWGHPKILDFGLAVVQGGEQLTKTGSTLGTVRYMSPEQIQGKIVDNRSDLFSLGVVLYEMITGRTPFERDNETATLNATLNDTPEPLPRYKSDVPDELQQVVSKLLEKDPALRYQSAAGVKSDLKRLTTPSAERLPTKTERDSDRKMMVVLPFANLGPSDDEYFADGMTEEIISRLSAIRDLGVISRTSAMRYKNTTKSIKEIATDLGVDFVLEGSVRWSRRGKDSDRVRITPQLIRTSDDTNLWSERYDHTLDDIFEVQSQIAEHVVSQLNIHLRNPERRVLNAKPTDNVDAYQAYLRGLNFAGRPDYSEDDFRSAIERFERAVELDPMFALAFTDLSRAHSLLYFHGHDRTPECISAAKTAVENANQLQPALAEVHLAFGYYHYYCRQNFELALTELDIAKKDMPHDSRLLALTAAIVKRRGQIADAAQYYEKAFAMSPRDASLPHEIGCAYMTMRKYAEAQRFYDLSISLATDQILVYVCKAWNYWLWRADVPMGTETIEAGPRGTYTSMFTRYGAKLLARDYHGALNVLAEASAVFDEGQWLFVPKAMYEAYAYRLLGDNEQARMQYHSALEILQSEIVKMPNDDRLHASLGIVYAGLGSPEKAVHEAELAVNLMPVTENAVAGPFRVEDLAFVYTLLGQFDTAIDKIEYLLSIPCWFSVPLLHIHPRWDPLREHPRFQSLLEKFQIVP